MPAILGLIGVFLLALLVLLDIKELMPVERGLR